MIRNYFKIAVRNIKRYATYSILNISGMAIGMACATLILLWVLDEWSYDRHFDYADDLFRVIEKQYFSGEEVSLFAVSPGVLPAFLKDEYPEIIRSARYSNPQFPVQKGNEFLEAKIAVADKEFLNMFNIRFVKGDIRSALNGPYNILITENLANKYFINENPVGKTLTSSSWVFTITGIVKSLPHNSHLEFDILFPSEFLIQTGAPLNDWDYRCYNYIQLQKGTDSKIVDEKIRDFIRNHNKGSNSEIFLQNIKKIHLFSFRKYAYDITGHGDIANVRILSLIAGFILLIACINFMNLSTAQSARRAREIGIRKAAGAGKLKIVVQFLGESLLIVLIGHLIAMIFVELLLPGYNNLTGKQLDINHQGAGLYIGLITIVLFIGLVSGAYPAFFLSSFKPLDTLRGINIKNPGNAGFRRVLVIFQFSLSILLIICTLIVRTQLGYMQNKDLGYNRENIGYFMFDTNPRDPQLETFKNELIKNPDIVSVTRAHYNPVNVEGTWSGLKWPGKKERDDVLFYGLGADADYAKTFQLQLKDGRFFSSEFSTDINAVVINEQAAKIMGLKDPVAEVISAGDGSEFTIIGVVKDFHFRSLHTSIEPLIMRLEPCNNFFIRMKSDKSLSIVESVNKIYKSFNNPNPLYFHFLDDDFDNLYRTEKRLGKIFGYFSLLSVIISCLGLIGLSSFMTERRTRETGIRKINGAKSIEILSLLLREFVIWVMISIIIACPIAWYAMHKWLQNFAYRTRISWWVFVLAGIMALLIALLTISYQTYKAVGKNPVEALRYE